MLIISDECLQSVLMSHNGYVNVELGQHFNLTCTFTCFTTADRVQMWKNHWLLTELSLSRDYPESKHTIVLFLLIPAVQHNDSGQYKCQNDQQELISSATVNIGEWLNANYLGPMHDRFYCYLSGLFFIYFPSEFDFFAFFLHMWKRRQFLKHLS